MVTPRPHEVRYTQIMKPMTLLLTACLVLAALPAFAQKAHKPMKTPPTTMTMAKLTKVSGGVKKPGVADGKFSIGSGDKKTKGTWVVDGSKATVSDKKGATVVLADILPGSSVTVEGDIDVKTHTISATKILATYMAKKTVPKTPKAPKTPKVPKAGH